MLFGTYLVRTGVISPWQFVALVEMEQKSRPPLGHLALEKGKLSVKQIFRVLESQAEKNIPFGRAAVQLGYMTEEDLADLLMTQSERVKSLETLLHEAFDIDLQTLSELRRRFYQQLSLDHSPLEPAVFQI